MHVLSASATQRVHIRCVEQRRGWGVEARPSVGTRHDVVDLWGVRHDFQDVAGQLCGGPPSPDGIVMREGGARI